MYDKLRRSDFLPVESPGNDEVCERGYLSFSDDDVEGAGMEYACAGNMLFNSFMPGDDGGVCVAFE